MLKMVDINETIKTSTFLLKTGKFQHKNVELRELVYLESWAKFFENAKKNEHVAAIRKTIRKIHQSDKKI